MNNVAKINLEVNECLECPYCRKPEGYADYYCQHDLSNPGIEVGDGTDVPDYCPFVIQRLHVVLKNLEESTYASIPKKYIAQIERRQREDPDPKFGADHGWKHISDVTAIGVDFLEHCVSYGFTTTNSVLKEKYLFRIAAILHDIGLADSKFNHAVHSSEMAKKFLSGPKVDIDEDDMEIIVHAIYNHSKGDETRTMVDAALVLADKLDVAKDRIIRETDRITSELKNVEKTEFKFVGAKGKVERAELRYFTNGEFHVEALRDWPKSVSIPMQLSKGFFEVPEFLFLVDGKGIDVKKVLG